MLADKWVLLVLGTLRAADGPVRFDEPRGRLDGIAQTMLTKTPRDLERDGLVRRSVYPTVPPRVEHSITELGTDLSRITHAVVGWVVDHQHEITAARAEFDAAQAIAPAPVARPGGPR